MIAAENPSDVHQQADRFVERPPLVIFAPYPPAKNGIADYVGELMPYHLQEFDVTLVVSDDAPEPAVPLAGPRVLLASEFRKHREHFEKAPRLYHVGNNPAHCYMLDQMVRDPGLVVLHDYNLNFMHESASLGWREPPGYQPALELEYGLLGSDAVRHTFERKNRGQFATYELPLNGDVLEAATGVIAHSRYVQYKVAARVPRKPVWYVPHHLTPAVAEFRRLSKAEARRQLGLPEHELLITALGFITYAKRIPMLLGALSELRTLTPEFRLVLGGEKRPGEYDVDADIVGSGLKGRTISTGYLDEERFFRHLAASDIVVNLRHPTGGESSGTLIRALGMGRPVVVFDHGPIGELPDEVVAKVPWNSESPKLLTHTLGELISNSALRTALGRRAAKFAHAVHDIRAAAERYASIVRRQGIPPARQQPAVITHHFASPRSVAQTLFRAASGAPDHQRSAHAGLWWRAGAVPLGCKGREALVIAPSPDTAASLLSEFFAWAPGSIFALKLDQFLAPKLRDRVSSPIEMGRFDYALCLVPEDLPENHAAGLLRRLNAALRRGGVLTMEVCPVAEPDPESSPFAEDRLPDRVVDAGFAILRTPTPHDCVVQESVQDVMRAGPDSTSVCILARKVSGYSVWRHTRELAGTPLRVGGRVG